MNNPFKGCLLCVCVSVEYTARIILTLFPGEIFSVFQILTGTPHKFAIVDVKLFNVKYMWSVTLWEGGLGSSWSRKSISGDSQEEKPILENRHIFNHFKWSQCDRAFAAGLTLKKHDIKSEQSQNKKWGNPSWFKLTSEIWIREIYFWELGIRETHLGWRWSLNLFLGIGKKRNPSRRIVTLCRRKEGISQSAPDRHRWK